MQVRQQDLFPTRVWLFEIPELLAHCSEWIDYIADWRVRHPASGGRSNRAGWSSDKSLFSLPPFEPLRNSAQEAFRHAFKEMRLTHEFRFRLEAWVNLHERGAFNVLHLHPNVLLSGSWYLQVPEGSGKISFRDPRPGIVLTSPVGSGANCFGGVSLQPRPGQLLVFPNWLEHKVEPHEADQPRISISMNALLA